MWYEVLPTVAIIGACLYLPVVINQQTHKYLTGVAIRRSLIAPYNRLMLERDMRVAGKLTFASMESIPDD